MHPQETKGIIMSIDATEDWFGEDSATFGDRLAGAREAAGLSRDELAEQLGVQPESLDAWENDLREPRANRLNMVSGLLGVSLRWLLTGTGEGPDAPQDGQTLPADTLALLAEIRKVRSEMAQSAERLGQLEKQLRARLQAAQ